MVFSHGFEGVIPAQSGIGYRTNNDMVFIDTLSFMSYFSGDDMVFIDTLRKHFL
jgi:hypothetical protein